MVRIIALVVGMFSIVFHSGLVMAQLPFNGAWRQVGQIESGVFSEPRRITRLDISNDKWTHREYFGFYPSIPDPTPANETQLKVRWRRPHANEEHWAAEYQPHTHKTAKTAARANGDSVDPVYDNYGTVDEKRVSLGPAKRIPVLIKHNRNLLIIVEPKQSQESYTLPSDFSARADSNSIVRLYVPIPADVAESLHWWGHDPAGKGITSVCP
jgi:hypothetical protein